jgi:hypothetical protein
VVVVEGSGFGWINPPSQKNRANAPGLLLWAKPGQLGMAVEQFGLSREFVESYSLPYWTY